MKAVNLKRGKEKNWWHEVCATIDNCLEKGFNSGAHLVVLYFDNNCCRGIVCDTKERLYIHEAIRKRVEERLERNGFIVMKVEPTALNGSVQNKTYISLF